MPVSTYAFVLALSFCSFVTSAQTVDEIIAKNIAARGGRERLKSLQTVRASGTFSIGAFRAAFDEENKRPNKVREDTVIQRMTAIEAFDGHAAWRVTPWQGRKAPDLMPADDSKALIEEADIEGQLVDYKNKDHRAELIGHDSVEGTDCYKIKLTLSTGDVRYYYIDTDSFLELKIETERNIRGTIQYAEIYYGDYEQINGIYFPFAIEMANKGDPERTKFIIDKVEVNVPIADSIFTMPVTGGAKP
jgi:hypothetical protein